MAPKVVAPRRSNRQRKASQPKEVAAVRISVMAAVMRPLLLTNEVEARKVVDDSDDDDDFEVVEYACTPGPPAWHDLLNQP